MRNPTRHKALASAATTAYAWILVLLIVAGWCSSGGWTDISGLNRDLDSSTTKGYECNYPLTPGASSSDMTPDGLPTAEGPAYVVLPLLHKTDNTLRKGLSESSRSGRATVEILSGDESLVATTSVAQVSSRLGRQLTLVGAKPSGTG